MKRFLLFLLATATLSAGCGTVRPPAEDAVPSVAGTQVEATAQSLPRGPFSLELVADFNIPTGASFEGTITSQWCTRRAVNLGHC